jgi:enhancing lycopene biosynthesis protein 2
MMKRYEMPWQPSLPNKSGEKRRRNTMKKIGVVLSGCGVFDGSEIHEAVFTLLAIDLAGCEAVCMAPNLEFAVTDHLTKQDAGEKRNMLVESARIARGKILDIKDVKAADLDAIILPGGFGAAKNLCDFAVKGFAATVNPDVIRLLKEMHAAQKPIGAICIAPALLAAALGNEISPTVTIGNDAGTAAEIEKTGAKHQNCPVTDFVVDAGNKIVTTPAYMLAGRISEAYEGIEQCVKAVVQLI